MFPKKIYKYNTLNNNMNLIINKDKEHMTFQLMKQKLDNQYNKDRWFLMQMFSKEKDIRIKDKCDYEKIS